MASRRSISSGDGLTPHKYGERTPLRSMENAIQHMDTPPSRLKSGVDAVKTPKDEALLRDPVSQLHCSPVATVIQMWTPTKDEADCGNITFKSFTCPGTEVEISDFSVCKEESIVLPLDQATHTSEPDDTIMSDSMMVQSSDDHADHPYYKPEATDFEWVGCDGASTSFCGYPSSNHSSGVVDVKCPTQELQDVTWSLRVIGEVEGDAADQEAVPPSDVQRDELSQDHCGNSDDPIDDGQPSETKHNDDSNSDSGNVVPVSTTLSETPNELDNHCNELNDVTFKSFHCTGGEIEISEASSLLNETVIPLPSDSLTSGVLQTDSLSESILTDQHDVQSNSSSRHLDHQYCVGNTSAAEEPVASKDVEDEVERGCSVAPDGLVFDSLVEVGNMDEKTNASPLPEKTITAFEDHIVKFQLPDDAIPASGAHDPIQSDSELPEYCEQIQEVSISTVSSSTNHQPVTCQEQEMSEDSALPLELNKTDSSEKERSSPVEAQQHLNHECEIESVQVPSDSCEAKDSALGSSGSGPLCSSEEKPNVQNMCDVFTALSDCPSVASALQLGLLSPVVRRASVCALQALSDPRVKSALAEHSPVIADSSASWADQLESPMPRPLFNSTLLGQKHQSFTVSEPMNGADEKACDAHPAEAKKPVVDFPFIPDGPLQQQLRQMAEFLMLASGKMGPAGISTSTPDSAAAAAAFTHPSAAPTETHSVGVGTAAVNMVDQSLNTSGEFERKRQVSVVDSCTLTDPLLWNVPPGSLECLHRSDLEQRLRSSMILVEALVQQLTAARAHGPPTGPAPSDLREKMVQTDHTELSQTTGYKELYLEALNRISELNLDGSSLRTLTQNMQDVKMIMGSWSSETHAALSNMKEMENLVKEDQQRLLSHYGQMKSLLEKSKVTQARMLQKVNDAFQQREDMRTQMEEANKAKEAAFSVTEQLKTHCATEVSELQRTVGSQQELLAALKQTYPEQVSVNQSTTEALRSAHQLLSETMEENVRLMSELSTVRNLLRKTAPVLLKLNNKAAAALSERDENISAREQAVKEREEVEDDLNETRQNLQTAREQISDLNLQLTIMSSEVAVLHEKMAESDQERGQLEMKVTELSATVSSTLASYTFLEQALASETTKLQQSRKDVQQATDRGNELEASLETSEQRVSDLRRALSQREEQLSQTHTVSESQTLQIQQLQDVCTQLSGMKELNEFLQMENDLAREQVVESERMLRANLNGLRERNIQCEDLNDKLSRLLLENGSLQEQLETTRSRASAKQLEFGEKLAQANTEITLLHHTLRGITNELQAAISDERAKSQKDKDSQSLRQTTRRNPNSSFVDSVMVALIAEQEEDGMKSEKVPESDTPETQGEVLFSEKSAFTRVAAVTPKKNSSTVEFEEEEAEEDHSSVAEMLADVERTVNELISGLKTLHQIKDAQLQDLQNTVFGLQEEQQAANSQHEAEVSELKRQLGQLNVLAEKGSQALQKKAQDEKTVTKLSEEIIAVQEFLNKQKAENGELRKEVLELRRSVHHSKIESQYLREELRKVGVSVNPAHSLDEKIQLIKEVERLKASLQEVEQARVKLLERAKRHQMIHQINQQKSENELQILNHMINKVRETLLSLPQLVKNCEQLQQLVEYIG